MYFAGMVRSDGLIHGLNGKIVCEKNHLRSGTGDFNGCLLIYPIAVSFRPAWKLSIP